VSDQGGWGPEVSGGGRRRRVGGRGLLRVLALVLVVALIATAGVLVWLSTQIPRADVDHLGGSGAPVHILVAGSDSREGLTRQDQRDLGTGFAGGARADTLFVMSIRGGDVGLLALPRDLFVERCDGSMGRINAAIAIDDGRSCLVETVRRVSGLDIRHYVEITFAGFVDVVDAVGGVEMCLDDPIQDADAHIDLPAGCQVLEGPDALGYVRVRKIDNDLQRIARQQEFMRALAGQVASPSTLLNPLRVIELGNEAGDAVLVDDGLGPVGMVRLARAARALAGGHAVTHTVPVTATTRGGAAVLDLEEPAASQLFGRFRDGSILTEARAGVSPDEVRVSVLNGAGVSGLAGNVGEQLRERGYEVAEVGNTDERADTVVLHPADQRDGAELLAGDLPVDATLQESDQVDHVTLLLGRDAGDAQ
jgi:LCP family protein required for cell wall assembly